MRYGLFLIPWLLLIMSQGCGGSEDASPTSSPVDAEKALSFMVANCYTCHDPTTPEENRIAPPMIAVKQHYLDLGMNRDEFITAMVSFVNQPSATNAKLPGAVTKFGLMPAFNYPQDQLNNLAAYIYDFEIEEPDWFEEHYKNRMATNPTNLSLSDKGLQYANATKAALGKQLMQALQQGSEHAVDFCHTVAIPLTDSMSTLQAVTVRRVSDKPRNPGNVADATSAAHIAYYQALLNQGQQDLKPVTEQRDANVTVYVPIVTNAMCLQCHGVPGQDIQAPTLAKIQSLYPADKATGYAENQVRGLFVVSWVEGN